MILGDVKSRWRGASDESDTSHVAMITTDNSAEIVG